MADPHSLLSLEDPRRWAGLEERLGFWDASISLGVSMLGTGIVAFPYAFSLCGCIFGPAVLIFFGLLAYLSYTSLIQCTAKMHVASYGGLLTTLPKAWGHYSNIALWLLLILATAAYVIISADIVRSVSLRGADEVPLVLHDSILFAVIICLIFPLCLLRSLHGLSVISTYCSCAIITVVGLIVWKSLCIYLSSPPPVNLAVTLNTQPRSVVLAMPILGCAMFGHMNISQIYAELLPKVKQQSHLVALTACVGVVGLYMIVGVVGYAAFGRKATPDVVAQIAVHTDEGVGIVFMQGLLASFIVFKTPLLILPLRSLSLSIIAPHAAPAELPMCSHIILTSVLLACVYVTAIALPNLGTLLEILGAVCVVPLSFVVPSRLSWALEIPRPAMQCFVMAFVGVLVSLLSLVAMFAS